MVTEHYQDGTPCLCDMMERTYYDSGELEYETPYVNGVVHGSQVLYDPYERVWGDSKNEFYDDWMCKLETPFMNGIKQGIGFGFFYSGIIAVENIFETENWVYQKLFYPSGKIKSEVACRNDQKNGIEMIYHESGELAEEVPFQHGKIHGIRVIHHGKEIFKDGWQIDGHSPYDFPDAPEGTITRITYSYGIRNGLETTHAKGGALQYEVEWKDGKRAGKGKSYNEDGTLLKETVYMYGEGIYGYTAVDTYATGEIAVDEALNHWFMPRGRENA